MTTGKDYGLPEEYADWVEVPPATRTDGEYLRLSYEHYHPARHAVSGNTIGHYALPAAGVRTFVPKPKPTLPDVKPGAVVRFRQLDSTRTNRAVKTSRSGPWIVLADDGMNWTFTGTEMLATFDMESATVELDGLE